MVVYGVVEDNQLAADTSHVLKTHIVLLVLLADNYLVLLSKGLLQTPAAPQFRKFANPTLPL
jgi:hypothetical protein